MKKVLSFLLLTLVAFGSVFCPNGMLAEAGQQTEPYEVSEVTEKRTKNSDTYLLSDGSYECVIFSDDKYYEDDRGELAEIDNSIVEKALAVDGEEYSYANAANSIGYYFSSDSPSVMITDGKERISFKMSPSGETSAVIGGDKDRPVVSDFSLCGDNYIMYSGVHESTDVVYSAHNGYLKEFIVMNSVEAPHSFGFTIDTHGLTVKEEENGSLSFVDSNGEAVFELGSLFAVDAADAYTDEVSYAVIQLEGDELSLTVTVPEDYVNSPEREYPILVDPSIMITGENNTQDSFVSSTNASQNYYLSDYLKTGKTSSLGVRRTFIRFTLPPSLSGKTITNSYLSLKKASGSNPSVKAYRVTNTWSSGTVTWNYKPLYSATDHSDTATLTNNWYRFYVTDIVSEWASGNKTNYGFMVKDANENNTSHWTDFYSSDAASPNKPELRIVYSDNGSTEYIISYSGNGNTGGTVPSNQTVLSGNTIQLKDNSDILKMMKAGSCPLLKWNTKSDGTGVSYNLGQTITPTSSMTLYAIWGSPLYSHRQTSMKVWVDDTYYEMYPNAGDEKLSQIVTYAKNPMLQVFNVTLQLSSFSSMHSCKSNCPFKPNGICQYGVCGSDCSTHHTSCYNVLSYVSYNGSSSHSLNTMLYAGPISCYNTHDHTVGGFSYLPGSAPNLMASVIQCDTNVKLSARRVQHEWSHMYGARDSSDSDPCTGRCIMNGGFGESFISAPDIWCSKCKAVIAAHLGDY